MYNIQYIVVTTACDTEETADKITNALIKEKLAACIQYQSIKSVYVWQSEVVRSKEILMSIKTTMKLYGKVEKCITENHNYDTPEIQCIPITGSEKYLHWITEVTRSK